MAARRLVLLALVAGSALAGAQTASAPAAQTSSASPKTSSPQTSPQSPSSQDADQTPPGDYSSSKPVHRKTGAGSSQTIRHTRVREEGAPPELTQAQSLIEKKDYAAAEPLLRTVVANDPANYEAWFDLGFVANSLGKVDESIAAYRKSVEAKPDVFESNLNLGIQLAKTGQPDAEQFLRDATLLKPTAHVVEGQERAWLSLGHVLEKSKPDDAVVAYQKASSLQPKDPEPHLAAGLVLEKGQKFADAEREYKQALALETSSDALTGLANIYMRGRRFPEAEGALRKLAAAHPEEASVHIQLGRVLAAESKNDEAIAELQGAAKLAPGDPGVQGDLAELYVTMKKYGEAEAMYRALLATKPDDAELHNAFGKALLEQKKFGDAQKEFTTTVKLKPEFGEGYGNLAFAASENKDYALALKALDARAKLLPEDAITYFLRGSAYDHLQDHKKAAANYHLFLDNAKGKYPDQEWQAKHRLIAIEPKK
jgi:Flp pilus assembly protein TadD